MKEHIIIYGAGNTGKKAYYCLNDSCEIDFFVDKDSEKWEKKIFDKEIKSPDILKKYQNTKLVIASIYFNEIMKELDKYHLKNVVKFEPNLTCVLDLAIKNELDERTIDLGALFGNGSQMYCKELTYIIGGSGILDYFFIKKVAEKFKCKKYVEIGTYIGESINILTDCCDELYSITACSVTGWCRNLNIPDYSERLARHKKIKHFYGDSKQFDFTQLPSDVDLFFIDADHSYEGIYSDTLNIFKIKQKKAIVIWHDMKLLGKYNPDAIRAVKDALQDEFKNFFVTNNNICGIYIPEEYQGEFTLKKAQYEVGKELYVYDTKLEVKIV